MSALAPSMPLIANAAPMPQASPPAAQRENGFARCLDKARDNSEAAPADEPSQRPSMKKPASTAKTDRGAREPGAARAAGTGETPPKTTSDTEANPNHKAEADTADTAHDDATAPDLAALLPGWVAPAATAPAAEADAGDSRLLLASAAVNGAKAATTLPRDDPAARALAQLAVASAATETNSKAATPTFASSTELQAAASEQRSAAPDLQSAPLPATLPSAPAASATTPLTPRAAEAPLPTAMATLPAAIDNPAFAPALATQVRWWTNDGVQQAQLLLNPAEMGPVAVKILLDGREARIDFSADLAATRSAIEAALPVLAAALDDGGLKLTGGGVHDGSAQRQPEWHARGVTHRTANATSARQGDAPGGASASPATAAGRGLVDLVA